MNTASRTAATTAAAATDLTDATDWLNTPLSALGAVEAALRCQICKDFYTTPMITSCSHTFCSLCIRRYLSQEGRCPTCRESDQEVRLRRNWVVEELVQGFMAGRAEMLAFARVARPPRAGGRSMSLAEDGDDTSLPSERPAKRRKIQAGRRQRIDGDGDVEAHVSRPSGVAVDRDRETDIRFQQQHHATRQGEGGGRNTRSQSRRLASQTQEEHYVPPEAVVQVEDSDDDELSALERDDEGNTYDENNEDDKEHGADYTQQQQQQQQRQRQRQRQQEPVDGLISCPICNKRMKEAVINAHLDSGCQNFGSSADPATISSPRGTSTTTTPPQQQQQQQNGIGALSGGGGPGGLASHAFASRTQTQRQTQPRGSSGTPGPPERLPTINYSLLNEAKLRGKLRDLGIPFHGSKLLMQRRHTEWVNLWNANCDSQAPLSKRQLLHDLNTWEQTQGRQIEKGGEAKGIMVKDFDRERYMRDNRGEFGDLVRMARERNKGASAATAKQVDCVGGERQGGITEVPAVVPRAERWGGEKDDPDEPHIPHTPEGVSDPATELEGRDEPQQAVEREDEEDDDDDDDDDDNDNEEVPLSREQLNLALAHSRDGGHTLQTAADHGRIDARF